MIYKIVHNEIIYAIIVKSNYKKKGINFFSKNKDSFQIGYINYPKGHEILKHYHPRRKKIIYDNNEALFIKKGKIRINFFDPKNMKKSFCSKILNKNDIILILYAGHGFEVIDNVQMLEIKQGPYYPKSNKIKFI